MRLFFLLLCLLVLESHADHTPLGPGSVLDVGIYENPPKIFFQQPHQPAGIFVDILEEIAHREGWEIHYVKCEWAQCLEALEQGKLDLLPDVAYSRDRASLMDFPDEDVLESWSQVYVREGETVYHWADLEGKRIVLLRGAIQFPRVQRLLQGLGYQAELLQAGTYEEAFSMVQKGKADAVITNHWFGDFSHGRYGLVKTPVVFDPVPLHFAMRRGAPVALRQALESQLRSLKTDPSSSYYQSLARWTGQKPHTAIPRLLWWTLGSVAVFLLLSVAWVFMLRRQVTIKTRHLERLNLSLQQNEQKFRSLFEHSPDGCLLVENGLLSACNPASLKLLDCEESQLLGKHPATLFPLYPAQQLPSDGGEWPYKRPGGGHSLAQVEFAPFELHGKAALFIIWKDIAQQKEAQDKLRIFHTISEQANFATLVANLDGEILYANPRFAQMHGWEPEEVLGKPLRFFHNESQMPEFYANFARLRNNASFESVEGWRTRKDGSVFPALMSGKAILDAAGQPLYLTESIMDMSEIKRKESEIRKLTQALEQSPVALIVVDLAGHIEYVNAGFTAITGYSAGEVLGNNVNMLKSGQNPPGLYKELWQCITSGKTWSGEWLNKRKNGDVYQESVSISPYSDERGRICGYLAVKADTTDRKRAEEERIARQSAEAANQTKSAFLSNMSHEIRTPLNAIIGFSQLLVKDQALDAHHHEQIQIIHRSGEHLLKLINDILDLSKIEAGHLEVHSKDFLLNALFQEIQDLFALPAKQRGLDLSIAMASPPLALHADEDKLRQVLMNLIGNALKFTRSGSISLSSYTSASPAGALMLHLEVQDTGPGIAMTDQQRIFDSFAQAAAGHSLGGTGLGLAICKKMLELMGGRIWVKSEPGQGSLFHVELPVALAMGVPSHPPIAIPDPIALEPGSPEIRLLIVDDVADNRALLRSMLEPMGFSLREASDGASGVSIAEHWAPHAVLMDLRMPTMDGYTATSLIRGLRLDPAPRILAITASALADEEDKARRFGFDAYIRKPFRPSELLLALQDCLGLRYSYEEKSTALPPTPMEHHLPPTLVHALTLAIEDGDMQRFEEALPEAQALAPALALRLQQLSRLFEYDAMLELLRSETSKNSGLDSESSQSQS